MSGLGPYLCISLKISLNGFYVKVLDYFHNMTCAFCFKKQETVLYLVIVLIFLITICILS